MQSFTLKTLASVNVPWNEARAKLPVEAYVGKVWPVIFSNKHGELSFLIVFLETDIGKENFRKDGQISFFFWGITLIGQNGKILTTVNIDYSQSDYSVRLLSILSRQPHNNSIYKKNYESSSTNNENHSFLSWRTKTMHIKYANMM